MLDPLILARFAADLDRLADRDGTLALAVSGGPDSMALLVLAHAARPGRIAVATVDHRLRAGSADEAKSVERHCATLGVPHATLVPAEPITGASIHARAREARYALLGDWARATGAFMLTTAHHADDQAETFLMRANRGSGLAGLTGVRARAEISGIRVVRPLLGWRRAELRAIADAAGVAYVDDPSNIDPRHDRARIRRLLVETPALDPVALARSAHALAESEAALMHVTVRLLDERATRDGAATTLDVAGLPRELRRRLVLRILADASEAPDNIEPLLDSLERGVRATQGAVMASPRGSLWRFEPAPPRRSP